MIAKPTINKTLNLSDRIRRARRLANLSQAGLARRLGLTASAVAQWENPKGTRPEIDRIGDIARVTAVDIVWLLTGSERESVSSPRLSDEPSALKIDFIARDTDEENLLQDFRSLSTRERASLCSFAAQFNRRGNAKSSRNA
jgi:transcriptional regulator with XRE-family HTH domain